MRTHLDTARSQHSPMPTGRTPGFLSSATRRPWRIARYAAQGGEVLPSQSVHSNSSSLSSAEAFPCLSKALLSSAESTLLHPAAPVSFLATASTIAGLQSRGIGSGTSSNLLNASELGSERSGVRWSGCLSRSTSMTGRPVLVHRSSGPRTPPLTPSVRFRTAVRRFPSRTDELYRRAACSSSSSRARLPAPLRAALVMSCIRASYLPPSHRRNLFSMRLLMS